MTLDKVDTPVVETLAIVGVGLIGSSLALAAKEAEAVKTVRLFDASGDVRKRATELELGDVSDTLEGAVAGADLVMICTPVGVIGQAAGACGPHLKSGAVVSDVGSVKASALKDMLGISREDVFIVPGHPIAGTEQSGPDAGFSTLFDGRWCILTPASSKDEAYEQAVETLSRFWKAIGSTVEVMTPERHDLVLAITSHLPHLIAFNIVATAADMEQVTEGEVVKYSAGGFRDFTRIAASDPTMWRDVFLNNKDAVLETLGRFTEDLAALQRAIRWADGDALFDLFTRARGIRQSIIEAGQDTAAPDFGRSTDED